MPLNYPYSRSEAPDVKRSSDELTVDDERQEGTHFKIGYRSVTPGYTRPTGLSDEDPEQTNATREHHVSEEPKEATHSSQPFFETNRIISNSDLFFLLGPSALLAIASLAYICKKKLHSVVSGMKFRK